MQAIDLQGNFDEYLFDKKRKVNKAHLQAVCKVKQGSNTCKYLWHNSKNYVCIKKTKMKSFYDEYVKKGKTVSKGDNCEGLGTFK